MGGVNGERCDRDVYEHGVLCVCCMYVSESVSMRVCCVCGCECGAMAGLYVCMWGGCECEAQKHGLDVPVCAGCM